MEDRKVWVNVSKVEFEKAILGVLRWQNNAVLTRWVRGNTKSGRRPDPSHWQTPGNVSGEMSKKTVILPYATFITVISALSLREMM
jgi:hypothetical protein